MGNTTPTPEEQDVLREEMLALADAIYEQGDGMAEYLGNDLARAVLAYFGRLEKTEMQEGA